MHYIFVPSIHLSTMNFGMRIHSHDRMNQYVRYGLKKKCKWTQPISISAQPNAWEERDTTKAWLV